MKKGLLILFVLASFSTYSFGCSCSFSGPFMKVYQESDLTIVAKIISKSSFRIKVEIVNTLTGKIDKKTIRITGDRDGASCFKELTNFLVGETYAFALKLINKDYHLSACGEYSLKIEDGLVKGMINDTFMDNSPYWPRWNDKTMPEGDFYMLFRNFGKVNGEPNKICECMGDMIH